MLKRDEAASRLRAVYSADWIQGRFDKLPARLAEIGRALLAVGKDDKPLNWSDRNKAVTDCAPRLFNLSARDRTKLFAAFQPHLADDLEAAFQLRARLPYPTGHNRRAYRAPGDAAALAKPCFQSLASILQSLRGYAPDGPDWVAAWAPHLPGTDSLGLLCAAAIYRGNDEVFETLKASATNEHEIGNMGRHVVRGLLSSARPDGWAFVEKLLLAAQRQEGLRQVILECIDEAHPTAFRRIVGVILDNDLIRFSATVRAIDVWFGLQWTALTPAVLRDTLRRVQKLLDDEAERNEVLKSGKGEDFYFALWTIAFEDASKAVTAASKVAKDADLERRYAAVHLLSDLQLDAARAALPAFLDDPDLRVAMKAHQNSPDEKLTFARLVKLFERIPEKYRSPGSLLWPWNSVHVYRSWVADRLPAVLGERSPEDLLPYLPAMSYSGKSKTIAALAGQKKWSPTTRQAMLAMLADKDRWARSRVAQELEKATLSDEELLSLEPLLLKKASDIRGSITRMLANRKPAKALESADRLLGHKKLEPRLGGLEILRLLVGKQIAVKECQQRAAAYTEAHEDQTEAEKSALEGVLDAGKPKPTLDDALGLMTMPRGAVPQPKPRKVVCVSKAAVALLKSLDALVEKHAKEMIKIKTYRGEETLALGMLGSRLPHPDLSLPAKGQEENFPLREVWQAWARERPAGQRDRDGLELLRAAAWAHTIPEAWTKARENEEASWHAARDTWANGNAPAGLKYSNQVFSILNWLTFLDPPADAPKWCCDTVENFFALVPEEERTRVIPTTANYQEKNKDWRNTNHIPSAWYQNIAGAIKKRTAAVWSDADRARWYRLTAWRDRPAPDVRRYRLGLDEVLEGLRAGAATEADLYDCLIGPEQQWQVFGNLTAHPAPEAMKDERLAAAVRLCRDRVIELELARGENPTAGSAVARRLSSCFGLDLLMRLFAALGQRPFVDSYYSRLGRAEVFTHLIDACHPLPADTPERFAEQVKEANIPTERLLQLAFLAPQWLRHVAHAVGWDGLQEGVWWLLAHTSSGHSGAWASEEAFKPDFKPKETWARILRERTVLTDAERDEKMVDVDWFHRVYEPLGKRRWEALLAAAKVGPGGRGQAKKAGFLADVILGKAKKKELVDRIKLKQHREAVRLLGLLPLARGERRDADLQSRYKVLMFYRRHARSLSPMGREGALRDLEIGLANLARTAGYPDATRLGWAMEAREMADLAAGPVSVVQDGYTITLSLDAENKPQITVRRGDKPLKAVPPAVKKKKKVTELTSRTAELRRQASRVRQSLEAMMCRAEQFSGAELKQLFGHPLLRPLLERLVLVGEGIAGYPTAEGRGLRDHAGKVEPVKEAERLRLAHPHDLFARGDWHAWQSECFKAERVQPFKQVFRELYVVTKQEKEDKIESKRYAGHQVNPSQSTALFGARGWATNDGVFKTFHEAGIIAEAYIEHHGWTAAEVEGLTFSSIRFRRRGEWTPLPVDEVPPILFSEVMRDGDLVVSVAHVGGVDPEASASTVQMRATLLRETCKLFAMKNVQIKDRHALIDGKLANYSVHLGSAGVHKMPGGMVCIVAVPAQHRGRLFLPFADDDPKTAEVISKVLLLARDHEIQDPSILEQLQ